MSLAACQSCITSRVSHHLKPSARIPSHLTSPSSGNLIHTYPDRNRTYATVRHDQVKVEMTNDAHLHGSSPSSSSSRPHRKALNLESINPAVLKVQYAVRGELAIKADKYVHMLADQDQGDESKGAVKSNGNGGTHKLPFDRVVTANIGNPQQKGLDQKPITYWRQIVSLLEYPDLLDHPLVDKIYPGDVIKRAKRMHGEIGSTGAYTHSKGVLEIRQRVAKFIEKRDGHPSDPESIFLTAGASAGVAQIMQLIMRKDDGAMIPIPQYPLYTATLANLQCHPVPYNLSESSGWSLSQQILTSALSSAKSSAKPVPVKALVVINPGNPTGGCLSRGDMEAIVRMCHEESIVLLADEVYQTNIYHPEEKPFVSFKKVLMEMEDEEVRKGVELVSFHSISKGVSGECGRRGGYFECVNIEEDVMAQLYKMASITLCPPVSGQIGVDLLVDPPVEGDESYPLFKSETTLTLNNLKERSAYMSEKFNSLDGMSCQKADGAMYLFPRIEMPDKAVKKAAELGKPADVMYALEMLDATGICAVAGSGFGQEEGTYHLRVTALCPGVEEYVSKIETFHRGFMERYA